MSNTRAVADWLVAGAPGATRSEEVLDMLCQKLVAAGIPLWRVSVFVRTLHPHIMGRRFSWIPGTAVATSEAPFEVLDTDEYLASPVVHVYGTGKTLRRRLCDPSVSPDFAVLTDLAKDGVTDYVAAPLRFTNGEIHVVSWTTREPRGFTDAHIAGLAVVEPALARLAEVMALRRTTRNLLDTYVGTHTGERILKGQIRRGDTESIHAAIWLSDMRGFTALADRLSPTTLVGLLNAYFDAQVPAIARHGGEVLKFMGDGLLAIFPVADGERAAACGAALDAAREARSEIATLDRSHGIEGVDRVRFGLALHVGEVLYGNIGGATRLDFTCIGPAVNLAARLEKLAGELGRTLLASSEYAAFCPTLTPVGRFAVRGIDAAQRVFGLPEEADRGP